MPVLLYRKQERPVGCLGNVELKIISYENKSSIISFIIDFNFPIMAKSQVKSNRLPDAMRSENLPPNLHV